MKVECQLDAVLMLQWMFMYLQDIQICKNIQNVQSKV